MVQRVSHCFSSANLDGVLGQQEVPRTPLPSSCPRRDRKHLQLILKLWHYPWIPSTYFKVVRVCERGRERQSAANKFNFKFFHLGVLTLFPHKCLTFICDSEYGDWDKTTIVFKKSTTAQKKKNIFWFQLASTIVVATFILVNTKKKQRINYLQLIAC